MDPPPKPSRKIVGSPQNATKISPLFNDADADTTFKSSDNVVFKIYSKHLQTASAALSPGVASMDLGETVPLSETSDILEILFQFVHPPSETVANYHQPSVVNMVPNLFFKVAEAAEKYVVFGAMNVCLTWMYHIVEKHPLRVLNHIGKHGYSELSDRAAELSVHCSLGDAGRLVTHPDTLRKWLIYCEYWVRLRDVLDEEPIPTCNVLRLWRFEVLHALTKNPKSIAYFFPIRPKAVSCNSSIGSNCSCRGTTYPWSTKLSEKRNAIPKFSSIILRE